MQLTKMLLGSTPRNQLDTATLAADAGEGGAPTGGDVGTPPIVDDTFQGDAGEATLSPIILDGELNFTEGYQEVIGENAKGSTFKNLPDVFKSIKEGQRTITRINQEKADLNKRLTELGDKPPAEIPADPADFRKEVSVPDLPDGLELSEDVLNSAVEYAMEKGYGPKELSDFLAFDLKRAELETEREKSEEFAKVESAKSVIVESVGEQNYDMTIANAKFALETLNLPLDADDLVSQPSMVLALAKIRSSLGEGTLKGAFVGGVEITSGSKLQQAEDIITNPENPLNAAFHDSSHPQYEYANQEHARLIMESGQ